MNPDGFPACTTCGNTIRSRRCVCRTKAMLSAPTTDDQMYYERSHPDCATRMTGKVQVPLGYVGGVRNYIRSRDWSNKDYIKGTDYDISDVYGSALSRTDKALLKTFDDNLAAGSIRYPMVPHVISSYGNTPIASYPSTTRYGMNYYDSIPDTRFDYENVPY